ncbi:hypothetical protein ANANG_G00156470 [Anguilla anguilla]|uniref:Uncharacterized protein n=1 Tax=Anguilla anguilla TaxID=7936 RepID=A0A9D3M7M7_ANGAN|nr:hypothetical protein ANANG_G00156470 [Anguilla anguilla]
MAAACLSPVLQGQLWFETPLRPLYRWGVLLYQKLQLSRYASALSAVMDVERLLTCSSQRELEAAMFCSGGGSRVAGQSGGREEVAWGDYWERNEPLRDADEVAVPVLTVTRRPCWSHEVALEYFRAVAEFLRAEERKASGTRGAAARGSPAPQWRTGAAATARRRRATVLRRARPPARPLVCFTVGSEGRGDGGSSGEEQDMFTWHRSYTR